MATNDAIPLFLSDHTEEPEQPVIGKAWDIAAISSRILKTSILVITAAAIVFAIRLVGNPLALFTNATASLVATSSPQDGTGQSMPIIQSTVGVQALPPTAREAPTGDEIAAAFNTAYQSQAENPQPPAEGLFEQYQAWAAEEDARTPVRPLQPEQKAPTQFVQSAGAEVRPVQPVQDAHPEVQDDQTQVVQNARAQVRPVQKHRHVKPVHNARAEIRPEHNARAQMRREQNTQAQVQPVQNAQPPGLLQSLGLMN